MMNNTDIDRVMRPKEPIPKFASYEEEAEFWDTHDLTDYWDDSKPTQIHFGGQLSEAILVRLDTETLVRLQETATERDVAPTTLVQTWIREHLDAEQTKSAASG